MSATYTRANLYLDIQGNASSVQNIDRLVNRAVRYVMGDIDLRSTKRMSYLAPYLNEEQYDYQAPSDLKDWAIIDVRRIANRQSKDKFNMTTSEYFDRNKENNQNLLAIEDNSFLEKLRISADLDSDSDQVTLHDMDSITANGTWAVGGSGSNLTVDSDNYVEGDASLNFDAGASYTSILLTNSTMTAVDLSDYETGGSVYLYVWIPSTSSLTSFKLRIGSDSSNYFERTVTVTNENLAFSTGWNLLRFDFASATETGTVVETAIDYLRLEVVGGGAAGATTDWRVDYITARRGIAHEVWYYTECGWQTSAGTYLIDSTASTDLLNVDSEEYELVITKAKEFVARDLKQFDDAKEFRVEYELMKKNYQAVYPSERLLVMQKNILFTTEFNNTLW